MAIAFLDKKIISDHPDLMKNLYLLSIDNGRFRRQEIGFGIYAVEFHMEGFEKNEPAIIRFDDNGGFRIVKEFVRYIT